MEPARKISLIFSLQVVFRCNENKAEKFWSTLKRQAFNFSYFPTLKAIIANEM